jgi:putative hydrolase of the HAD superfamily
VSRIDAVLFDMGGVLVRLDSLERVLGPSALGHDEIWPRWILSPAVRAFERGRCSVEEFAESLVEELELDGTAEALIERFRGFPLGLFPGAAEMVASVPDDVVTGILSNTNALHWHHQIDNEVVRTLCDHAYLSFELDAVKPDRAIFDCAIADLGLEAGRVLFLDDNDINVEGAREAGLVAEVARGPEEAATALRRHGVI